MGVVGQKRWDTFLTTKKDIEKGIETLEAFKMSPEWWVAKGYEVRKDGRMRRCGTSVACQCPSAESTNDSEICNSAFDLLHYKGVSIASLVNHVPELCNFAPETLERLGIAGKYKQHILRQSHDIALFERDEYLSIDSRVDYDTLPGMSHEVRQRLKAARPETLVRPVKLDPFVVRARN